jgi:hypothetical protein
MNNNMNGAHMLPSFCPSDAPPGEQEVFRMLANESDAAGWAVLHSLDLADHVRASQGEADFVVLIPNEGILVVEVKSHTSVLYTEQGWWLGGKHEERGPFKQASEALHSIRKYLDQRELSRSIPMVSAVIFSSAPFQVSSSEWHPWQVLDKQGLHARKISANLLKIIQTARGVFASKNLPWMRDGVDASQEKLARIAQVLRPRFEVLASPSERRKHLDESLKRCTEQQFRILDGAGINPRLLVTGLAGTGKTTLAVEVVRREKVEKPESVVGFFCFTKLLGGVLAKECSPLGEGIRLGSFHSWMLEFSGIKPTPERADDPAFWNRDLPELCVSKLTAPGMPSGFLDLLVLDEAQDLFIDAYLDIFDLLLKGGLKKGRWRFFGDFERQDIFGDFKCRDSYSQDIANNKDINNSRLKKFYGRIEERCALQPLSENCRNTQEISAALTLHARLKPGYSRVLREDSRHDPALLFYSNQEEQLRSVLGLLDGYHAEGFKASEIVLLSPQRAGCLARLLAEQPAWKGRLREYSTDPSTTTFSTIHAFKGLEAPVVILTDIRILAIDKDFDLLYVGMSRALHRLAILCDDTLREPIKKSCLS